MILLGERKRIRITIIAIALLFSIFLVTCGIIVPFQIEAKYGFAIINESTFDAEGIMFDVFSDCSPRKIQKAINSLETEATSLTPAYGELFEIGIVSALGFRSDYTILYSPEFEDFFLKTNHSWKRITSLGIFHHLASEWIRLQTPCGFRYELFEKHLFLPKSHFSLFDDSIWKDNTHIYKSDGFSVSNGNGIKNEYDAFEMAKTELRINEAIGTWCYDSASQQYLVSLVSTDVDTSSENWWKSESENVFSVVISSEGTINELYSFKSYGVLDFSFFDITDAECSERISNGWVIVE